MSSLAVGGVIIALVAVFIDVLFLNAMLPTLAGVACLVGSILVGTGVIPNNLLSVIVADAIMWTLLILALWKWGGLFSDKPEEEVCHGYLVLNDDLSADKRGRGRFSGVDWDLILDPSATENFVKAGTKMVITKSEVGLLTVKPAKHA